MLLCIYCFTGLMQEVHVTVLHYKTHAGLVSIYNGQHKQREPVQHHQHTAMAYASSSSPVWTPRMNPIVLSETIPWILMQADIEKEMDSMFRKSDDWGTGAEHLLLLQRAPDSGEQCCLCISMLSARVNQQSTCTSCCCAGRLILVYSMDGTRERVMCCCAAGEKAVLLCCCQSIAHQLDHNARAGCAGKVKTGQDTAGMS